MVKKHIMHSDIVEQMTNNNEKRIEEIINKVNKAIMPLVKELEKASKGDECLVMDMYIRKGNDMLTQSIYHVNFGTSSTTLDGINHLFHHQQRQLEKYIGTE